MKVPSRISLVSLSFVASFVSSLCGVAHAADVEVAPRGTTPGLAVTVARDGKTVAFTRAGAKPVEIQVTGRPVAGKKPEVVALSVGAVVIALVFYFALRVSLSNEVTSVLDRIAHAPLRAFGRAALLERLPDGARLEELL